MAIVFAMQLSAQEEVTYAVGEYGTGTSSYVPLYTNYDYSYSQSIYPADSLQPGMITAISYKYVGSSTETINPSIIYMGAVNRSAFSSTTDWVPLDELTEVFNGSVTLSNGWVRIELDEPFLYAGGNLVVAYMNERGDWTSSQSFNAFPINQASLYYYRDYTIISASNPPSGTRLNYVPSTKFHFSGEAVDICYPPMNLTVSNITSTDAEITWTANENSTSSDYGIAYKTQDSEEWIELDNVSGESTTISDLSPLTRYDVKVWTICSDGNSREVRANFCTNVDESMIQAVPYFEDFDNADDMAEWTITNGTVTNKWYHGMIENNTMIDEETLTDGGAMYISNDGGTTNAYTVDATSIAYFSTFVGFGDGPDFKLTFDRKYIGESNGTSIYDYVRVYLMDVDAELSNSSLPDESNAITEILGPTGTTVAEWVNEAVFIPNTYANTTKKLVFMWRNDNGGGENPPAAIDNIAITELVCGQLNDVAVTTEDMDGSVNANVSFTDDNSNSSEYIVEYKVETESEWMTYTSTDNPVVVPDLLYGKRYELRVYAVCDGADTSFMSETVLFNTPCTSVIDLPYVMDFEETFQAADGVIGNRDMPLCWYNINGGYEYYYWNRSTSTSGVYSGNQSIYFSGTTSTYSYAFSDWIISPVIELSGAERLNFKAKATYSDNSPVLKVYAKDVTEGDITSMADTSSFTLIQEVPLIVSEDFEDYEIGLVDYSASTRIALVVNQASSTFYLDSLVVSALPDCPDVYGLAVNPASSESVSVNFNTSNGNGSGWVIAYGQAETAEDFDPESAEFTANVSDAEEVPYIIDGLTTGETYYFAVQQDCGGAFTAPVAVTLPVTITLPYEQNFDDAENMAEIIIDNNTATNQWHYGTAVNNTVDESGTPTAGGAIYISDDNGVTNNYTLGSASTVYFSTVIEFGDAGGYVLTFDRKQIGESMYDYTRVYLMDMDQELTSSIPNASYAVTDILRTTNSAWVSDTVILDESYANTVKKLVFMWRNDGGGGTQPPAAIDNIKLEARNCVEIEDFVLTTEDAGESANITVSFTDPNEAGNYIIEYKSANDTEWTVLTDISDNTYTIEELPYATQYYVRVQAVCSDESSSIYVQASIYTACAILPAPWSETFDENITTSPCWDRKSGAFPEGTIQTSDLSSSSYGWSYAASDQINGVADTRMKVEVYSTNKYWLITPTIDLGDGSTTYQIAADVMLRKWNSDTDPTFDSDDMFAILVSTDNGTSWSSANALVYKDGDEDTEHNYSELGRTPIRAIYKLVDADDNPITGQVRFAFYGGSTTFTSGVDNYLYIDNVEVSEWSECQAPYGLTVSNISYNSANVAFSEAGEATEWEYVLVEEGGDMETADAVAVYENPIELTDLEASTTYTIAVRSVCSDGSTTSWSPSLTFTTKCLPVELPWEEGFENITANNELPACMEATSFGDKVLTYTSAQSDYNQAARTGNKFASFKWSCNDYMFTPGFELTAGNEYTFSFWYVTDGDNGWTTLEAKLCSEQTEADVISTIGTAVSSPTNTTYQEYTGTFIPDEDGVYYIAIHCVSTFAPYYLSIDDLSLTEGGEVVEPCAEPTNLTVTNITETSADLTWTAGGSESSWQVRLGEDGDAVDVTVTSHTFTELTASTQYTAYVRANCGESYSTWVSIAFTTAGEGVVNPVVTTVEASNVTETEATLNATVVEGSEAITARGFKYRTTGATDWTDVAATGTTTLTATLTDLTPATSYEFKAYVTVGTEEFEGEVLTFTTENGTIEVVVGEVSTEEATAINDHTAVLNGTLTSNGGDDSYTVGFLMSTMEDFDMETPNVVNLPATETAGALTANATELESGTNYFFRAYITNDAGTAYGEVKTFVTTSGLSDAEGGLRAVIYPNPASGKATVEIEGLNESARLIVTDLQGRVLSSDDLQSGASRYEMDLTGFASGVYYIRIVTDNSVSTQKLIVK